MPTQQISRDRWDDFLSAFSAHNQTRQVNIDVQTQDQGTQRLVNNKALLGLEPDLKDERAPSITVVAGDAQGGEPAALTHEIARPKMIWIKEDDTGQAQALDIETDDGRTIIQFV